MLKEREQTLHLALGESCNNNCIFCMEERNHQRARKETPYSFYSSLLKESQGKFSRVVFTSGEPTLYKELPSLIHEAKQLGFPDIFLISNGKMFYYKEYLQKLVSAGLNMIAISIHGPNAQVHETCTRAPGSFKYSSEGMKNVGLLRKTQQINYFSANTTLTKLNYLSLSEMYDYFHSFGIDEYFINFFNPLGAANSRSDILLLKYSLVEDELYKLYAQGKKSFIPIDIPPCTFTRIPDVIGEFEDNHVKELDDADFKRDSAFGGRTFLECCKTCKAYTACNGIPQKYLELYGDDEFKPL